MRVKVKLAVLVFAAAVGFSAVSEVRGQAEAGGAIVAIDEPAAGAASGGTKGAYAGGGTTKQTGGGGSTVKQKGGKGKPRRAAVTMAAPPPAPSPVQRAPGPWNGPVLGDKYTFLNFEVQSAAKPYHTRDAKANGAKGLVQVEILIDTDGSVISARARTGDPLLHPEAERAARESRFRRPTADGRPARAVGFLVYRFGPAED